MLYTLKVFLKLVGSFFVLLLFLQSCKPGIPSEYLSSDEMEDILYDYHIAQAMADNQRGGSGADMITYRVAILKKYNVTEAEFDSSMVYYSRHTELLHDVYKNLVDRLKNESVALGADANDLQRYGDVASGDTTNIWNGNNALILSPNKPFNLETFSLPVDSAYHKGDRILFDFDAQFLYQDGMRDGIVVLAVTFANDSVASQLLHIQNSQHFNIQLEDRDRVGIKAIKGYFLLGQGNDVGSSETTLRLLIIDNIKMVRMHIRESFTSTNLSSDSLQQSRLDSSHIPAPGSSVPDESLGSARVLTRVVKAEDAVKMKVEKK